MSLTNLLQELLTNLIEGFTYSASINDLMSEVGEVCW